MVLMVRQKVLGPVRLAYAPLGVVVVEMAARRHGVWSAAGVLDPRHVPGRDSLVEWCQDVRKMDFSSIVRPRKHLGQGRDALIQMSHMLSITPSSPCLPLLIPRIPALPS